jgi:abequosyltransferase
VSDSNSSEPLNNVPLLAIVIPTYNRAAFLPDLFASILDEWDDRLEVIVSDNNSTDETKLVVQSWQDRLPRLKLVQQSRNIGPDRNFMAAVEGATATFCWLFGSDDILQHGAIATILGAINEHSEMVGASVNYRSLSYDLSSNLPSSHDPDFEQTRVIQGAEAVFVQIGHHLGFLSGQIVRRSSWMKAADDPGTDKFLNGYIHVYLIGRMISENGSWLVLKDQLVGWRTGNDSFLTNGRWRRMRIDVQGYAAIGTALFGKTSHAERTFRSNVAAFHIFHALVAMRLNKDWVKEARQETRALLRQYYADLPVYWRKLFPFLYLPNAAISIAAGLRRRVGPGRK